MINLVCFKKHRNIVYIIESPINLNATFIAMHNNFFNKLKQTNTLLKTCAMLVLCAIMLVVNQTALASGKPVGKKRLFLIPAAAYFFNSTYWDPNGIRKTYDNNQRFGSFILSLSSEYGFSRRVSLVATIPLVINTVSGNGTTSSNSGLGDAELGVRFYVANIDYNVYFSVQGSAIIPLYTNTPLKSIGYDLLGAEVKLAAAGDFALSAKKFYWEVSAAPRQYFDGDGPFQAKGAASLSYSIDKHNQISLLGTTLYSFSNLKTALNTQNPLDVADTKNFNFTQLTGSYSYSIKRNKSVFASYSQFISGKNTGVGTTIAVGYVYKY